MREVSFKKLIKRAGLYYFPGDEQPFSGRAISYFTLFFIPTKKVKSRLVLENGEMHGEYLSYYRNGHIREKGHFKFGQKHSEWLCYYLDGELKSRYSWFDGKKHGEWIWYYESGKIMYKYNYIHGERKK